MIIRALLVLAVTIVARPSLGLDVTACNTIVPDNEVAVLQTDMSCGGAFVGVRLLENATLDMQGHSITGPFPPSTLGAVECAGVRCTILSSTPSPGRIGGGDFNAVAIGYWTYNRARLRISNVDLHDARSGIQGAFYIGYQFDTRVKAEQVTSHGHSRYGLWVERLTGTDVSATENGVTGFAVGRLRGTNLTASNNTNSGVFGDRVSAVNLTANDNGETGVRVVAAKLKNSTILGNNGLGLGVDLATVRRPGLRNTVCGKSQVLGGLGGLGWGVCQND